MERWFREAAELWSGLEMLGEHEPKDKIKLVVGMQAIEKVDNQLGASWNAEDVFNGDSVT
ncbi:hypothetical protein [Synechococcus sp. CCY 0621]|uniref:hypothetical protein n=1 Tax=Synechococcus sp. CCY 0621 TaxID=2815603 RepID=UPI001C23ADF1|nr:hypothetical protein [Synechococcus sp. CCY 0621]